MKTLPEVSTEIDALRVRIRKLERMRRAMERGKDLEVLMEHICLHANITFDDMVGDERCRVVSDARCIFAYKAAQKGYSKNRIASYLNKDRTSVYYMLEKFKNLQYDGRFQSLVNKIN